MLKIKDNVRFENFDAAMIVAFIIANEIFAESGIHCRITSANDSMHSDNSLHYKGLAIDVGIRDNNMNFLSNIQSEAITRRIRERLGAAYDVVLEKDHIHIEYDPK